MNAAKQIYIPKHLEKWTMPSSYFGATHEESYVFLGQNRDSDVLTRSNFEVALERLGGESETVQVIRNGHWACGWIEFIAIHESDEEALKKADEMMDKIENRYPVLDETHYSEMEYQEFSEYAEGEKEYLAQFLEEVFSIPEELKEETLELAYQLNLEVQMQNGEQSAFHHNIYSFRKSGDFDTCELRDLLERGDIIHEGNERVVEYLKAVLGMGA